MNTKKLFYYTFVISIIVQLLTGVFGIGILFIKVPSRLTLIRQLLMLEVFVQIIEGLFYYWVAYNLKNVSNITPKRYLDWIITTPTMLFTLILYLIYIDKRDDSQELDVFSLSRENMHVILPVFMLNWIMLLFGYLGEMNIIPIFTGVILGFIPFLLFFYLIYQSYYIEKGGSIFWYFLFFWAMYGFVALLPYYWKNSLYNIIDLFAKNVFGIFLSYTILKGN